MKRPTIADVAKSAGVSKGTVSYVINGRKHVDPATRDKIIRTIKEMNFRPRGTARNLKTETQGGSIGLILRELSNPFYTSIATGVREYADSKGYSVIITSSENDYNYEKKLSTHFAGIDIKGLIISPVLNSPDYKYLQDMQMINYPFVLLDNLKDIYANTVTVDKNVGMQKAIKYLVKNGHKKIIYFGGLPKSSLTQERIEIFKHGLIKNKLLIHDDMIEYIGNEYDKCFANTINYFKDREPSEYPTAILCFSDNQAIAVIAALKKMKIVVPQEISVIGYDDSDSPDIYTADITTIKTPQKKIGIAAAKLLIKNIESQIRPETKQIVFETELIIKKSTVALYR